MNDEELERVKQIKRRYEQQWLSLAGVVAVGIGTTAAGKVGVIVSVKENPEKIRASIPQQVDGIDVEIRVTGELRAL
jgi:hypothetical protein